MESIVVEEFSEEDVNRAISLLTRVFKNRRSDWDGGYIVGDRYTLADISWSPTITTMIAGGYDEILAHVTDWYENISTPQFRGGRYRMAEEGPYAAGVDPTIPGPLQSLKSKYSWRVEGC